ncbi:MAG: hypothetical protein WKG07_03725 [Hymenobacter sp.]
MFAVVLPKTAAALGDQRLPAADSLQAYQDGISKDADEGLPGDPPKAERTARADKRLTT